MNVEQNDRRWLEIKHDCGEIVQIDSEEFPDFFSEPDEENKKMILHATCPKCSKPIIITRETTIEPSEPPPPDKPLAKWKWKWE